MRPSSLVRQTQSAATPFTRVTQDTAWYESRGHLSACKARDIPRPAHSHKLQDSTTFSDRHGTNARRG